MSDTSAYAMPEKQLAKMQAENTQAQKERTAEYKQLTSPKSLYLDIPQSVKDSFDERSRFVVDLMEKHRTQAKVDEELHGKKPDGWGVAKWWSDAKTQFLINMNEVQRDEYAGKKVRASELDAKIKEASQYKKNLNQIKWYVNESKKRMLTDTERNDFEILKYETAHLKSSYEYVKDATPTNWFEKQRLGINQTISKLIDAYLPKDLTSGFADDVDAMRLKLLGFDKAQNDKDIDRFLKDWHLTYVDKMNEWQDGIDANQKDIDNRQASHKISDYFKYKERTSSGVFNFDVMLYKQPGLFGSSMSSYLKQATALAENIAIAAATSSNPYGWAARAALGASVSLPTQMSASESENNAEVAQNYRETLRTKLASVGQLAAFVKGDKTANGDTDAAIENFINGKYVPTDTRILRTAANAAFGANALFRDDMAATTGDDIFDTALMLVPFGKAAKTFNASKKTAKVAQGLDNMKDQMLTGMSVGGPIGGVMYTAGATALGSTVDKAIDGTVRYMKKVPLKVLGKSNYKKTAELFGVKSIPHRVLSPESYVQYQTIKQFGKEAASRTIKSGISEGIEEGKQYEHGNAFAAGEYRDREFQSGIMSLETMLNDFTAGIKTAYVMAGMLPFIPATTNDADLIENIEGGILGGLFQTGAQVHMTGVPSVASQMKVNHFVAKQALYEKLQQRDAYEKYKLYAKKAGDDVAIQRVNEAFKMYADAVKASQGKEDAPMPSIQMIEEQQRRFNQVASLADTEFMREAAKNIGIKPNGIARRAASKFTPIAKYSDEYRQFVATVAMLQDGQQDAQNKYNEAANNVYSLIQNQTSPYSIVEGDVVRQKINQATNEKFNEVIAPIESGDSEIGGEELLELKNNEFHSNIELFANISTLKQLIAEVKTAIKNKTDVKGNTKDLKFVKARLEQELKRNLDFIKKDRRKDVLDNVDEMFPDVQNIEEIKSAVRQKQLLQAELDYHQAVLGGVLGEYGKPESGSEEEAKNLPYSSFNAKDIMKQLEKSLDDDFKLQENIEKDWLKNFESRSEQAYEDNQKKLEEWREKVLKKAAEREEAAKTSINTQNETFEDAPTEEIPVERLEESSEETPSVPEQTAPETSTQYTREQQDALTKLAKKRTVDESRMTNAESNVDRTGHDYFIKDENGKVQMYGRVHSYLDRQYPKTVLETTAHDKKVAELRKLWDEGKKDEFKAKVFEYQKEFEDEYNTFPGYRDLNLNRYIEYLEDGNEDQINNVIEAIADLTSTIPADASVIIGQVIDDACRTFFTTGELPYSQVEDFMAETVYEDFLRQLKRIKQQYDDLGWVLVAQPHYFYSTFFDNRTGSVVKIAGETDMIGIDKEGNYHVIDFKTSKKRFHDEWVGGQKEFNPFTDLRSDMALNDQRVQARSTKDFYTDQQSLYNMMMEDNLDAPVVSRELLPFVVSYKKSQSEKSTVLGTSFTARIDGIHQPIEKIKNEIPETDPETHNLILEEGSDRVKMGVYRIQLEMSPNITKRFIDKGDDEVIKQRLNVILNANPFDFFYEMSEKDRENLQPSVVDDILKLADEYNNVVKIIGSDLFETPSDKLSIIAKGENILKLAASLQQVAELSIEYVEDVEKNTEDAKPEEIPETIPDSNVEDSQKHPVEVFDEFVKKQITDTLDHLETLKNDILYEKYNSPDGTIDGSALTSADQLLSNLQTLFSKYPDAFTTELMDEYEYLRQFFADAVGITEPVSIPQVVNQDTGESITNNYSNLTTTWKSTLDDSIGIEQAKAEDGSKLLDVTGDPEFITDAIFELVMKVARGRNRVHVIVHYKGKTYEPVSILTANTTQGRAFYNAVRLAVINNPGKKIIIRNSAVSRTNGTIKEVALGLLTDQGIINDDNFYDICYNSTQTQFGITKATTDPVTNAPVIEVKAPGESVNQDRTLYVWSGTQVPQNLHSGSLVMFVNPLQNEPHANKPAVPLTLEKSKLSEDDAQLVIDILTLKTVGPDTTMTPLQALTSEFVENENGLYVNKGLTNL